MSTTVDELMRLITDGATTLSEVRKALTAAIEAQPTEPLDRATATAIGGTVCVVKDHHFPFPLTLVNMATKRIISHGDWAPSSVYAQGGPLIDEYAIATRLHKETGLWHAILSSDLGDSVRPRWNHEKLAGKYGHGTAEVQRIKCKFTGKTRLEAACRCLVASVLGPVVEIPEELC